MLNLLFCVLTITYAKTILVHFHDEINVQVLNSFSTRNLQQQALAQHAENAQRQFLLKLNSASNYYTSYQSFWIQNTVAVYGVMDKEFVRILLQDASVKSIEEDSKVYLEEVLYHEEFSSAQSNIADIKAPQVWSMGYTGKGIVVASIDSGVRYSHDALKKNYRGYNEQEDTYDHKYSFWSYNGIQKLTPDLADQVGHGTHAMGILAGSGGIGVAPDATWIAAQAFHEDESSSKSEILAAAQWVMCPSKDLDMNCSLGADIVTNSFGGNSSIHWMDRIVQVWRSVGIFSAFASGNTNGFACGTVLCPGCGTFTFSVGATIGMRNLWGASGKGPGMNHTIKPDMVAPGFSIRSAFSLRDDSYQRLSGTSMATPHVAGAVALLLEKLPQSKESIAQIEKKLRYSASIALRKPFLVKSKCDNIPYNVFPNNIYGYGFLDAQKLLQTIDVTIY